MIIGAYGHFNNISFIPWPLRFFFLEDNKVPRKNIDRPHCEHVEQLYHIILYRVHLVIRRNRKHFSGNVHCLIA
jgi:hypothetical protein